MVDKWAVGGLIAASCMALIPTKAHGACAAKEIAGVWDAYSLAADEFGAYWQRCLIRFDAQGTIVSGNCKNDSGGKTDLGGELELRSNCRIKGTFVHTADGFSSSCDIIGNLSGADKKIASGVGECDNIAISLWNLLKRS